MNLAIIAQLVQILKDAPELGAIEVRRGLFGRWSSIRVTKVGHGANAGGGGGGGAPHLVVAQASGGALVPGTAAAVPAAAPKVQLVDIKSPMVGTFYSAPEPGAEPYVKAGSRVAAGQVVCIIEAMKIMNEIEAEVAGLGREICVENAQPVEFGQIGRASCRERV